MALGAAEKAAAARPPSLPAALGELGWFLATASAHGRATTLAGGDAADPGKEAVNAGSTNPALTVPTTLFPAEAKAKGASALSEAMATRVHTTVRQLLAFLCAITTAGGGGGGGGGNGASASLPSVDTLEELQKLCSAARAAIRGELNGTSNSQETRTRDACTSLDRTLKGSVEAAAWLQRLQQGMMD